MSSITLPNDALSLAVGQKITLTPSVTLTNQAAAGDLSGIIWSAADQSIVGFSKTQDEEDRLEGLKVGQTTITAQFEGFSQEFSVTVGPAIPLTLSVEPLEATKIAGLSQSFVATATYTDSTVREVTNSVSWQASGDSLILSPGSLRALGSSSETIKASLSELSSEATLHKSSAELVSVHLAHPSSTIGDGALVPLQLIGVFTDGSQEDVSELADWTSAATSVATVSDTSGSKGRLRALAPGNSLVSASLGALSASQTLSVATPSLSSLVIQAPTTSVPVGLSVGLKAIGRYSNGMELDLSSAVAWTSDTPSVLSIASGGLVTAVSSGLNVTITATLSIGASASATLKMSATSSTLDSVVVSGVSSPLSVGDRPVLTATAQYSDGQELDVSSLATWSSASPAVVAVSNLSGSRGRLTALSSGSANLTASYASVPSAPFAVSVEDKTLTRIEILPADALWVSGLSFPLSAQAVYSDASTLDVSSLVTWSSDDASVATVDSFSRPGLVSVLATGSTKISIHWRGKLAELDVVVPAGSSVSALSLTSTSSSVAVGQSLAFVATATVLAADSSSKQVDVTSLADWSVTPGTGTASISNLLANRES